MIIFKLLAGVLDLSPSPPPPLQPPPPPLLHFLRKYRGTLTYLPKCWIIRTHLMSSSLNWRWFENLLRTSNLSSEPLLNLYWWISDPRWEFPVKFSSMSFLFCRGLYSNFLLYMIFFFLSNLASDIMRDVLWDVYFLHDNIFSCENTKK